MIFKPLSNNRLLIVLALVIGTVLYVLVPPDHLATFGLREWLGTAAVIAVMCIPLWILKTTSYQIAGDSLEIRQGPFKTDISLSSINKVETARNGLRIWYDNDKARLVSPQDRAGFLKAIGHTAE